MADKQTFSARVDARTKDELYALMQEEGNPSPAAFMARLVGAYRLQKAARALPLAQQDVADLQTHLAAIESVYCGLLMRVTTQITAKDQEAQALLDEAVADLQAEKSRAEDQQAILLERLTEADRAMRSSEAARKRAEDERNDLARQDASRAEALRVAQELAEQYKAKAEALAADAAEAGELRAALLETRKAAATAQAALADSEAKRRQEVLELREKHQDAIEAIRREAAAELREARGTGPKKKPGEKDGGKGVA